MCQPDIRPPISAIPDVLTVSRRIGGCRDEKRRSIEGEALAKGMGEGGHGGEEGVGRVVFVGLMRSLCAIMGKRYETVKWQPDAPRSG